MRIDGRGGVLVTSLGQVIAPAASWTLTRDSAAPLFDLVVTVGHVDPYWWTQATAARVSLQISGGKTWTWPDVALPPRDEKLRQLHLQLADHPIVT